jgi:peptidoglycan/LPS O-acetylase OafA/YrhL
MTATATTTTTTTTAYEADRAYDEYRDRRHFGCLDGLRFLCIAAVIWHHAPVFTEMASPPLLLRRGFLGVDMFFVLSGYLITTLLLREESREGRFSLRAFYWRRLLRIVPVYYGLVAAVSLYWIVVKGETNWAPLVPFYFLFLANFLTESIPLLYPMWSLAVEEQYYLVWPLMLLVVPRRWMLHVLGVLIALNVVLISVGFSETGDLAIDAGRLRFALPNATYAPILLGSGLALLMHDRRWYRLLHRLFAGRWTPVVTFGLLVALAALLPGDLLGLPNLAIHLTMTACLASLVLNESNVLAPALSLRPVVRVGMISYGLYLYHLVGLDVANRLLDRVDISSTWAVLVLYSAISYAIAEISYSTLEAYFRGLKARRSGERTAAVEPVPTRV